MVRDRILMCPPDHFRVDYDINPWMSDNLGSVNLGRTQNQWRELRDVINQSANVIEMEAADDVPDMVFTANAGAVYGNKAIASHFTPIERRSEEKYFKKWFRQNGFELFSLDETIRFEGAGDCLRDRSEPWLWTGYGFRTDIEAHQEIEKFFGLEVVSIKLVDPRFYHIDTCFCPLANGFLMYYPAAFNKASQLEIERRVAPEKRIIVDTLDATNFACNAVNIGDAVIMNKVSGSLQDRLGLAGFAIHEVNLSEFIKAGGSAKCLTLKVTEPKISA